MNENNISYSSNSEIVETSKSVYTTDPIFIISLVVNVLLLLTTAVSELMATSSCPYNSLWGLITSPIAKKIRELNEDEKEQEPSGEV